MVQVTPFLSAANVEIYFGGRKVGQMQNLNIASDFGSRRIDSVYQSFSSGIVRGVSHYDVKATKAFVSLSSIFGSETDWNTLLNQVEKSVNVLSQGFGLGNIGNVNLALSQVDMSSVMKTVDLLKSGSGLLNVLSGSPLQFSAGSSSGPDINKLYEKINEFKKSPKSSIGDLLSTLEFDIVVKSDMDVLTPDVNSLAQIGSGGDVFTLKGCKVVSRNISISVGSVVIMEDMNIFAKDYIDSFISRTTT